MAAQPKPRGRIPGASVSKNPMVRRRADQGTRACPDTRAGEGKRPDDVECVAAGSLGDGVAEAGPEDGGGNAERERPDPGASARAGAAHPEGVDGDRGDAGIPGFEVESRRRSSDPAEGSFQPVTPGDQELDPVTGLEPAELRR